MQWNVGTASIFLECVLKTLPFRGLRVGPSRMELCADHKPDSCRSKADCRRSKPLVCVHVCSLAILVSWTMLVVKLRDSSSERSVVWMFRDCAVALLSELRGARARRWFLWFQKCGLLSSNLHLALLPVRGKCESVRSLTTLSQPYSAHFPHRGTQAYTISSSPKISWMLWCYSKVLTSEVSQCTDLCSHRGTCLIHVLDGPWTRDEWSKITSCDLGVLWGRDLTRQSPRSDQASLNLTVLHAVILDWPHDRVQEHVFEIYARDANSGPTSPF